MRHLEGDSEVYKMMQENRETRALPRQSSTFRLLQVALELDEKGEGRGGWEGKQENCVSLDLGVAGKMQPPP